MNIMDFKQMFDAEALPIVLNLFIEACVTDEVLALGNETNKSVQLEIKTPNGMTKCETMNNKVMQGDVLSPLVSSNMVDINISKPAIETGIIYMYKNQVVILPLLMQDDSLAVSACGFKTRKITDTCTNLMCLQFGQDKCIKMHVEKNQSEFKCVDDAVDTWVEQIN